MILSLRLVFSVGGKPPNALGRTLSQREVGISEIIAAIHEWFRDFALIDITPTRTAFMRTYPHSMGASAG